MEEEKLEAQTLMSEVPAPTEPAANIESQNPIKRFQATVKRTFSKKDDAAKPVQLIGFQHKGLHNEHTISVSASDGDLNNSASCSSGKISQI